MIAVRAVRAWKGFVLWLHASRDRLLRMACAAGW
jgi:hypothetical protein